MLYACELECTAHTCLVDDGRNAFPALVQIVYSFPGSFLRVSNLKQELQLPFDGLMVLYETKYHTTQPVVQCKRPRCNLLTCL